MNRIIIHNSKFPFSTLTISAILVLSFMYVPNVRLIDLPFHLGWDKLVHGLMYTVLTMVLMWETTKATREKNRKQTVSRPYVDRKQTVGSTYVVCKHTDDLPKTYHIYILLFSIALGAFVELGQEYLTTWRSGRLDDCVANTLGTILGYAISKIVSSTKGACSNEMCSRP